MTKSDFQRELVTVLMFNSNISNKEPDGNEVMMLRIRRNLPE